MKYISQHILLHAWVLSQGARGSLEYIKACFVLFLGGRDVILSYYPAAVTNYTSQITYSKYYTDST